MTAAATDEDYDFLPEQPVQVRAGPGSFDTLGAFVTGLIAPAYARTVRDADTCAKWCPHWHDHPAAAWRLHALWRAWEALPDDDPDAQLAWWLQRADPTMAALGDPRTGPFTACGPTRHRLPPDLPTTEGRAALDRP